MLAMYALIFVLVCSLIVLKRGEKKINEVSEKNNRNVSCDLTIILKEISENNKEMSRLLDKVINE